MTRRIHGFTIGIFLLSTLLAFTLTISTAQSGEPSTTEILALEQEFILAEDSFNDIASARITCYLHLKTTQVQLDITFVGSEVTMMGLGDSRLLSINEEVSVFGNIRSVNVIESDDLELTPITTVIGNSTHIQFQLSTEIPTGFSRNVKITYIQDTEDFLTHHNYELGVTWQRRIGNQNVLIIFDRGLAYLNCFPAPHSISTVDDQLVLSWLEVNRFKFYINLNYTSMAVIEDLDITPTDWDFGQIKRNTGILEKTFEITNNENRKLEGTIESPDWITVNVTDWELNIGETMYLKATLQPNSVAYLDGNITIKFSIASYPVHIHITGQITRAIGAGGTILIILATILNLGLTVFGVIRFRAKTKSAQILANEPLHVEEDNLRSIDTQKWKELLTDREFTIFNMVLENNRITQADICRKTDLSKSTVSRAVGRLETKGLIKKEKYGMSNIVTINSEFFSSRT